MDNKNHEILNLESRPYRIHAKDGKPLDAAIVSSHVTRITRELDYKGEFAYFPVKGDILLVSSPKEETAERTFWFLQTLCATLAAQAFDEKGNNVIKNHPDSDTSFIEGIHELTEPYEPVRLYCAIEGVKNNPVVSGAINGAIVSASNGYYVNPEDDGFTVEYAHSLYLDIYYRHGDDRIVFDMDAACGGARFFLHAYNFASYVAEELQTGLVCYDPWSKRLQEGGDYDELRRAFYPGLKQLVAGAVMDDQEGYQAYINWLNDTFEVEEIPGTVATIYGRLNIRKLISEIEDYGFAWVADHYFLLDNYVNENTDRTVKEVLYSAWMDTVGMDVINSGFRESLNLCADAARISKLLRKDPSVPIPTEHFKNLCHRIGFPTPDLRKSTEYRAHYEPGYRRGSIYFGIGSYLRRLRMPGNIDCGEFVLGESIGFTNRSKDSDYYAMEIDVYYFDSKDAAEFPSNFGNCYAKGKKIPFDIGGSSICRFIDGGQFNKRWRAEAAILIDDELYRFAICAAEHDTVMMLFDIIKNCRAMDEWYDPSAIESDSHAPGSTFFIHPEDHTVDPFTAEFPTQVRFLQNSSHTFGTSFNKFGYPRVPASDDE